MVYMYAKIINLRAHGKITKRYKDIRLLIMATTQASLKIIKDQVKEIIFGKTDSSIQESGAMV